jgi:Na+/H+ antiporter NhaC
MDYSPRGAWFDLVIPIVVLVAFCVSHDLMSAASFDGSDFITAFADTDASVGLPWRAGRAHLNRHLFPLPRVVDFRSAMGCIVKGFVGHGPPLLILTFAITLITMTGLLGADAYVAGDGGQRRRTGELPARGFFSSPLLAFSTGTSGAPSASIPIVVAVFPDDYQLMIIGHLLLPGAVCADHCSPIPTHHIMSSAGAQCASEPRLDAAPYRSPSRLSFLGYILAPSRRAC